eukprot:10466219-Alexandrium_andersonii.AAC.1
MLLKSTQLKLHRRASRATVTGAPSEPPRATGAMPSAMMLSGNNLWHRAETLSRGALAQNGTAP